MGGVKRVREREGKDRVGGMKRVREREGGRIEWEGLR